MKVHIRYASIYSATQDYAQELARVLGLTAHRLEVAVPSGEPVIFLGPFYGPTNKIVDPARAALAAGSPVAVGAVGMTLSEVVRAKDPLKSSVGEQALRVYLPGRLLYSTITPAHRAIMSSIVTGLKLKPLKSANDKAMIEAFGQDVDRVDFAELAPLIDWAKSFASESAEPGGLTP